MELREAKEFLNSKGYELLDEGFLDKVKDAVGSTDWDKENKKENNTKEVIKKWFKTLSVDAVTAKASNSDIGALNIQGKNDDFDTISLGQLQLVPISLISFTKDKKLTDESVDEAIKIFSKRYDIDKSEFENRYLKVKSYSDKDNLDPVLVLYQYCNTVNDPKGARYWKMLYPKAEQFNEFMTSYVNNNIKLLSDEFKEEDTINKNKKILLDL